MTKTLLSIVGPTAVGKTSLSLLLAQRLGAPILSCDSRQFYRYMDIGTAKPTAAERAQAPHYFIDCLDPDEAYNAGKFAADANSLLETLFQTHDTVVVVGGSTLYINALWHGIDEMPAIPAEVRATLNAEFALQGLAPLLGELERVDPVTFAHIDRQNHARVIRALEVYRATGEPIAAFRAAPNGESVRASHTSGAYAHLKIALTCADRAELYRRIDTRVGGMLANGLVAEVEKLLERGYSLEHNALRSIGYEEVIHYLQGELTHGKMCELIQRYSRQYAKRQLTWFRRYQDVQWLEGGDEAGALQAVERLL